MGNQRQRHYLRTFLARRCWDISDFYKPMPQSVLAFGLTLEKEERGKRLDSRSVLDR